MTGRLKSLEIRQQELKTQCNHERRDLEERINSLDKPLAWVDKGLSAIRFFKSYPLLLTGAFAALAQCKPKLARKVLAVMSVVKLSKGKLD